MAGAENTSTVQFGVCSGLLAASLAAYFDDTRILLLGDVL